MDDWRIVFYVLIGASLFTLILIWIFIYDSPRGYINNNNYDKVKEILEGIASFNGKLDSFRESIMQDEYQEIVSVIKGEKAPTKIKGIERPSNTSENNQSLKEDEYEFSKDISVLSLSFGFTVLFLKMLGSLLLTKSFSSALYSLVAKLGTLFILLLGGAD